MEKQVKCEGIPACLKRYKAPVVIILMGMLLIAVLFWEGRKTALENLHKQFSVDAATRAQIITDALQAHLIDLESLHRLYHASEQVDRRQFNKFVAPTLKTRPGVQAFEWIPRVPYAERARFEAEARRDGLRGYQFYQLDVQGNHVPVEPREYYYPVYYVEPLAGNEPAVGFDLGSNPARLAALDQATDTGQPTATERITLVQETGTQAGFLIYMPVYREDTPLATVEQRRLALEGFVLGVFRAGNTVEAATRLFPEKNIWTELVDLYGPADGQVLYRSAREPQHLAWWKNWLTPAVTPRSAHPFTFAGRQWQVDIMATSPYVQGHISLYYWLIPPLGISLTLLLALYLGALLSHKERAKNLAAERTAALTKTTNMLELILESIPVRVFWKDKESRFMGCNTLFARDAGCRDPQQLIGNSDFDMDWREQAELYRADDRQVMESRCPKMNIIEPQTTPTGDKIWLKTSKVPLQMPNGEVFGVLGVYEDITERKRAEEALRESEEKYRLLVSQIPAMVFRGYGDWSIDPLDEKVEVLTGYSKEDFEARRVKWCDLIPAEDLDYAAGVFIEALKTDRSYVREHRLRKKNGEIIWVQCRGQIFCDDQGKVNHISGVSFDVTQRRQAEEAVRESERFLADIFASIQDGFNIMDLDFNILRTNPTMERWFAHALPLAGKKCYEAFYGGREPCEICPYRQTMETGKTAYKVWDRGGKDGAEAGWLEIFTFPITDMATGQVKGAVEYIRDITARQQAEEALRQSEEQLRQAVKIEAVGRLAGGVAHDFNNILTAITGYCELLLKKPDLQDPVRQDVTHILAAAEQAATLTRQLLAFSRKQVLQPRPLNLNRVVANLDKMLGRIIGEDIELVTVLGPDLWTVMADPGQIEQVIMNLVVNARDAMPQGGRLTIETANADLDEAYSQRRVEVECGPYVMLAVSDTGVGFDRESRDRIFEPFYTTKELGKGTGLGLSTVYGIIKQSGGYIWVYSEPGEGTTFKIYLPRLEAPGELAEVNQIPDSCEWGSETILLVEDEELVRRVTGRILARHGYTVLEAVSGSDALVVSREHAGSIHLMLTDVVMPGMSGQELAGKVKSQRPTMKVLFMSGYTENAIIHHGVLDPDIAFIQKPFKYDTLARKVREMLDGSRDK
jgi:PAS domain S-box-containing protein